MGEDFRLKWNDHHSVFFSSAEQLCHGDHLTDVTLSCGTKEFSAHKLVLSICSGYFNQLFAPRPESRQQQLRRPANSAAIVYLKDVDSKHMELLLNYMYRGEINVEEKELMGLLATAKGLQIKGLTESDAEEEETDANEGSRTSTSTTTKRSATRPSVSQQPSSKRIKEEPTPQNLSASLSASGQDQSVQDHEEGTHHDFSNQDPDPNTQFVDIDDPSELIDQSDYSLDGNQSGEPMVYEGDPENSGKVGQHSQQQCKVKHEVSEKEFEMNLNAKQQQPVVILKESNHACFACPKAFAHKWMLERHLLTHTGEQPFACSICLRRFSLQASCLRHVRHVHKDVQGGLLNNYVVKISENQTNNMQNHAAIPNHTGPQIQSDDRAQIMPMQHQ